MHSGGHRPGAPGARLWCPAAERRNIDPMERRRPGQGHRLTRARDIAVRRDLGAAPQKPPDAQGDRGHPRYRAPGNSFRGDTCMTTPHDYENIPGTYVYDAE